MQTLVTDSKIIVSPPGFASHSLPLHWPEYTSIGRGRRRSSLFLFLRVNSRIWRGRQQRTRFRCGFDALTAGLGFKTGCSEQQHSDMPGPGGRGKGQPKGKSHAGPGAPRQGVFVAKADELKGITAIDEYFLPAPRQRGGARGSGTGRTQSGQGVLVGGRQPRQLLTRPHQQWQPQLRTSLQVIC